MQNISSGLRNKTFNRQEVEFSELQTVTEDGKRFYLTPDGSKYPSVTTVLGSLNKQWIYEWRARVGEQEANKISTYASTRGTRLHNLCEKYMLNHEDFAEKQMPLTVDMFKSIQKYIDMVDIVYGNEIPLYSHELKTAGRADLFCNIGGKNAILDFKTSSKHKTEEGIESYFLQATTYALMIRELKGIDVPKLVILIAVEGNTPQYFIKSTSSYEEKVRTIFKNYQR